jgi:hypothetical protein
MLLKLPCDQSDQKAACGFPLLEPRALSPEEIV